MVYIYQKNKAELYLQLQNRLKEVGLEAESPDAFVNIINDFITSELVALSNEFNNKLDDYSLLNATGTALDTLAEEMYSLYRLGETKAFISSGIELTNTSQAEVIVPKGTLFSAGTAFNEGSIVYELVSDVTISGDSSNFGSAIAIRSGSEFNIERDYLTQHNLNNTNILVRNLYPIVNGRDVETDEAFRARLLNFLPASVSNNLEFLRLNLLEIPGVINVKFIQGYHGLGTTAVFVSTAGNRSSDEVKALVNSRIQELTVPGDKMVYEEGARAKINLTVTLTNTLNYSSEEILQIKYLIRTIIGQEFVKAKTRTFIDFNTIETQITNQLRSRYSFTSSNNTIFSNITKQIVSSDSDGSRPIVTLNPSGNLRLKIEDDEVPELGDLIINVELVL